MRRSGEARRWWSKRKKRFSHCEERKRQQEKQQAEYENENENAIEVANEVEGAHAHAGIADERSEGVVHFDVGVVAAAAWTSCNW